MYPPSGKMNIRLVVFTNRPRLAMRIPNESVRVVDRPSAPTAISIKAAIVRLCLSYEILMCEPDEDLTTDTRHEVLASEQSPCLRGWCHAVAQGNRTGSR
jgi:hypothetical protein